MTTEANIRSSFLEFEMRKRNGENAMDMCQITLGFSSDLELSKKQSWEVIESLANLELNLTKACSNKRATCLRWAHYHTLFSADGPKVESLIEFKGRAIKSDYRMVVTVFQPNAKLPKLLVEELKKKPKPKPEPKKEECCICLEECKISWRCKTCNAGLICGGCKKNMKGVKSCPVCRTKPITKKK